MLLFGFLVTGFHLHGRRLRPNNVMSSSKLNEKFIETNGSEELFSEFSRAWRERKPLLARGAVHCPDFDANAIAGLALEADVPGRLIRGEDKDTEHAPLNESVLTQLERSHWTILVNDAEIYLPEAADFSQKVFTSEWAAPYAWLRDDCMLSVSAPLGGVGPHVDSNDVLLIQCAGRRRWSIESKPVSRLQEKARLDTTKKLRCLTEFQADLSWELDPGDLLFVPARIPHDGIALTSDYDQFCITCSLGFRTEHSAQILLEDFVLSQDIVVDENDFSRLLSSIEATSHGTLPPETIEVFRKGLMTALEARLNDEFSLISFLGQLTTTPRDPTAQQLDDACWQHTLADHLGGEIVPYTEDSFENLMKFNNDHFILHHAPGARFLLAPLSVDTPNESEAILAINGRIALRVSKTSRPLADALTDHRKLKGTELYALLPSSTKGGGRYRQQALDILHTLLRSGVLLLIRMI
uniref:JmjC domain-containing protein n=1 Tax=Aureoumbra lagunensis TaxID=44058 RepID=A0A7S3NH09_9STRA|mmetsp:Transcript_21087/g.32339  ORF Transcript_21087/g.32339 Transcript_21087/m.32339 type:complete len:468 (+) Transcript_21087:44-1447(+)